MQLNFMHAIHLEKFWKFLWNQCRKILTLEWSILFHERLYHKAKLTLLKNEESSCYLTIIHAPTKCLGLGLKCTIRLIASFLWQQKINTELYLVILREFVVMKNTLKIENTSWFMQERPAYTQQLTTLTIFSTNFNDHVINLDDSNILVNGMDRS